MAGAPVSDGSGLSSASSTVALSAAFAPTTGNHLTIVVVYINAGASRTITYNSAWGTVTTPAGWSDFYTSDVGMQLRYVENCNNTSSTGSITASASCDNIGYYVLQSSGLTTSSSLQVVSSTATKQSNPGTGAGAISTSLTIATAPAYCVNFVWARNNASWRTASSDTARSGVWNISGYAQTGRALSTGSRAMTFTTNAGTDDYYKLMVAFNEASSSVTVKQLAALGCG